MAPQFTPNDQQEPIYLSLNQEMKLSLHIKDDNSDVLKLQVCIRNSGDQECLCTATITHTQITQGNFYVWLQFEYISFSVVLFPQRPHSLGDTVHAYGYSRALDK